MSDSPQAVPSDPPQQTIYKFEDNAALYVERQLVLAGPLAAVTAEALARAGITTEESTDFLLGREPQSAAEFEESVATSIDEIDRFGEVRDQIVSLRAQAAALEAQAAELEATIFVTEPMPATIFADESDPLGIDEVPQ